MFLFSTILIFNASRAFPDAKNRLALNELVYEIRNPQTDSRNFRMCLERIGEYLSLEILEELNTKEIKIQTLTKEIATHIVSDETPILITILRAGLPLCLGAQKIFPRSEVGFLGMSRDENNLKAKMDYIAIPELKNKTIIIIDTMIATGGSILDAIKLIEKQEPKQIIVLGAIASKPGIRRILEHNPEINIYIAATDPFLNDKGYIIPGLGDAGDRAYGKKQ